MLKVFFLSFIFFISQCKTEMNFFLDSTQSEKIKINFEQFAKTYKTNFYTDLFAKHNDIALFVKEQFSSTVFRANEIFRQDEQLFFLKSFYKLEENFAFQTQLNSFVFSNDRKFEIANAYSHNFLLGTSHKFNSLYFEPLVGYKFENQKTFHDKGVSIFVASHIDTVKTDNTITFFNGNFQKDFLTPRVLENDNFNLHFISDIESNTKNFTTFTFAKKRREFYFSDTVVESRIDKNFSFTNTLDYEIDVDMRLKFFASLFNRTIEQKKNVEEKKLEIFSEMFWKISSFILTSKIDYFEQDEIHSEQNTISNLDNIAKKTSLYLNCNFPFLSNNTFTFNTFASVLRYDTPSNFNYDDRDEIFYDIEAISTHKILNNINLKILFGGTSQHLSYILKERSANNFRNFIIRFSPSIIFSNENFFSLNSAEVLSNYTVYDFETMSILSPQSISFRQYKIFDSTKIKLSTKVFLETTFNYKIFSRGELNWNTFEESPITFFEEIYCSLKPELLQQNKLLLNFGFVILKQNRFNVKKNIKTLVQTLLNIGPTACFNWEGNKINLNIDVLNLFQFVNKKFQNTNTNFNITLILKI